MDGSGLELMQIIQECNVLKMLYKNVDTTITGGYIIEFWTMDHLNTFLKKCYIYDKNKKLHWKMISIYRCADQNRYLPLMIETHNTITKHNPHKQPWLCVTTRWIRGLTKLPPTIISELLLKVHHVHCTVRLICNQKNKWFKGCVHILCESLKDAIHLDEKKGEITFDRINLCKVNVVNKKRTDVPPEEQPVPHTQTL
jgi:hypothetical protein